VSAAGRVLDIEALSARYGHVEALAGVSLFVGEGELVAVLGPNGAGKSTLMRAVMGLLATQGVVRFRGKDVPRRNPVGAAAMGLVLVPEGRGIFAPMSVAENLELGAYLLDDKTEFARRQDRVLSLFPRLKERLGQVAGSLSGGEQQMLAEPRRPRHRAGGAEGAARSQARQPRLHHVGRPHRGRNRSSHRQVAR
jgi:branched-chain amino acid transport system ATP-binding protein